MRNQQRPQKRNQETDTVFWCSLQNALLQGKKAISRETKKQQTKKQECKTKLGEVRWSFEPPVPNLNLPNPKPKNKENKLKQGKG